MIYFRKLPPLVYLRSAEDNSPNPAQPVNFKIVNLKCLYETVYVVNAKVSILDQYSESD